MSEDAKQLSLWEESAQPPPGLSFFDPSKILTIPVSWANGDKSRADLEKLALVVLGDRETCYSGSCPDPRYAKRYAAGFAIPGLERYIYQIRATGIVGDQVYAAYEFEAYACDHMHEITDDATDEEF